MKSSVTQKLRQDGIIKVWRRYSEDAYEIAKTYGVSASAVYGLLREYCKANNLNYKNLLRHPKKPYYEWNFTATMHGGTEMIVINGKKKMIKNIRTEIKHGATAEDFAKFFESSEEEFLKQLSDRLGQRYSGYKRLLEQNKKKGHSETKAHEGMPEEVISEGASCESREEELKENIVFLQSELKTLYEEKREAQKAADDSFEKIEEANFEVAELQTKLDQLKSLISSLRSKAEKEMETLCNIQRDIDEKQGLLEEAEAELETYKEVIVSFTEKGIEISIDGFEPTSDEIEAKNSELSKLGKFDDYALKHTKAAAAVLCAVESLEVMEMRYYVDFNNCIIPVREILTEVFSAA